ncbi:hypothetical protein B0H17DRAFT_1208312 [Mycena rosella]|uniref:CCHC-type domain-containing protein n=1 Tax=Mycena rosella TaxID=1033263 RepID=A0AAD7D155_MYCRO|nr:hypothetical protein B0H17DRAFT_1208312 [Mycena rosella]
MLASSACARRASPPAPWIRRRPVPVPYLVRPIPICVACGAEGHERKYCPNPDTHQALKTAPIKWVRPRCDETLTGIACFRCGEEGHALAAVFAVAARHVSSSRPFLVSSFVSFLSFLALQSPRSDPPLPSSPSPCPSGCAPCPFSFSFYTALLLSPVLRPPSQRLPRASVRVHHPFPPVPPLTPQGHILRDCPTKAAAAPAPAAA